MSKRRFIALVVMSVFTMVFAGCVGEEDAAPSGSTNSAPIANAGVDQSVTIGSIVYLDGSASSDADGGTLTYAWSITSSPSGSIAVIADATSANASFTPDIEGSYTVQLIVNDGIVDSTVSNVAILVTPDTAGPIITSTTPSNFENPFQVPSISITFNEEIIYSSISNSFIVKDTTDLLSDQLIDGSLSINGKTVVFTPTNNLERGRSYSVTILPTVVDLFGNMMSNEYSWSFSLIPLYSAPTFLDYSWSLGPPNNLIALFWSTGFIEGRDIQDFMLVQESLSPTGDFYTVGTGPYNTSDYGWQLGKTQAGTYYYRIAFYSIDGFPLTHWSEVKQVDHYW